MHGQQEHQPPRWARRFIEWYCRPELAEDLLGDLNEYFERNLHARGLAYARLVYAIDALKFIRGYTVRMPEFTNILVSRNMIGNYVKTSGRNLMRNKLFSTFNILGLAFSMAVGLLLIVFLFDMFSYDRFHTAGDHIYRITSTTATPGDRGTKFGTSSVRAGRLIREQVAGVEEVAMMQRDFSADAEVADGTLPLAGFWAEPSLFRVFTFPMLAGNPDTALEAPYSVVLTETSARKLFGGQLALGREIKMDSTTYQVTGILKDIPFFSHLQFEALVSFATLEQENRQDAGWDSWAGMWSDYVYIRASDQADPAAIQSQLDAIARSQNREGDPNAIQLGLMPLYDLVVGEELGRTQGPSGPHMSPLFLWMLAGLGLIVILSACFNYTNLTIARSMRRFKEIGLRKTVGAGRFQVRMQFLAEAVLVSLAALVISFFLFLLLRPWVLGLAPELHNLVRLGLSPARVLAFVLLAVAVGLVAGFLPALLFSWVSASHALRNTATVKVFRYLPLRRALMVVQYTVTLVFITVTVMGYVQYKHILAMDLGFDSENILNIDMQGNDPEPLLQELRAMPEITGLSRSLIITSIGNAWGGFMKYDNARDSALVLTNHVDENYLDVHNYQLVAGSNFISRPQSSGGIAEVIVNQKTLERFQISPENPQGAIGAEITFSSRNIPTRRMRIAGVIRDFHYGRAEDRIEPAAFLPWTPGDPAHINVKISGSDLPATLAKIESTWKTVDAVHPFKAQFYDQAIEDAYNEYSALIKITGFLAFLAITIASLGLFGMVLYATETRMKEIGIRKVMGAGTGNLVILLGRGFIALLAVAAAIALPATFLFFKRTVLSRLPFHEPIHATDLFGGFLAVLLMALLMIGSITLRAANRNPARVLKRE